MNKPPLHKSPLQRRPLAAYRLRRDHALFQAKRDRALGKAKACLSAGRGFAAELYEYNAFLADRCAVAALLDLVPLIAPELARTWIALR